MAIFYVANCKRSPGSSRSSSQVKRAMLTRDSRGFSPRRRCRPALHGCFSQHGMWNHDFFRGYPKILFINHGLLIWDWHYCNICLFWFGFGFWELHDSWASALFLEQRNRSCLGPHVRNAQLFLAACSLLRSRKKRCFLQQLRSNTRV